MKRALEHPLQTVRAMAAVLRASLRVTWFWHEPRTDLPTLVASLRRTPHSRIPLDPLLVDGVLERLLPLLPPWQTGPCVKRSLMLIDLRSRAGLEPCLHLGHLSVRSRDNARTGHVWVTTTSDPGLPPGVIETWHS